MYPVAGNLPTGQLVSDSAGPTEAELSRTKILCHLMRRLGQIIVNGLLLGLIAGE